jgi:hypothetical protein
MEQQSYQQPYVEFPVAEWLQVSQYDWNEHLPKMISLYLGGMPLPEIYKAIQDEATGFTPK